MAIRAKLVIIIFVFAILPMFLLWARWQGTAIGSITSLVRQDVANRALEISNQLDQTLKSRQAELAELAQQPALRAYVRSLAASNQALPDAALQVDLSAYLLAHQQQYAALLGINRQGGTLFKIEAKPGPSGVPRPFFELKSFGPEDLVNMPEAFNAPGNQIFVSEVRSGAAGAYLWLIAPLHADDGNAAGAVVAKLKADQLLTEAVGPRGASITAQPEQYGAMWREVIVLDAQGTVLYAADAAKQNWPYGEAFTVFEPVFKTLINENRAEATLQNWIVRHRIHNTAPRLSILVLEKYRDAVAGLEYDSIVMLLLTTAVATVATLCLYFLISTITASIRRITSGAKAIASGDLGHQIKVRTNDETRLLAQAFNRMAARLREMIRKEGEQKQFESFARLSAVLTHDLKNQILSLSLLVTNMERKFHREGFREDAMRTLSDTVSNLNNLVAKLSDPRTPTRRIRETSDITHLVERVLQRTAEQAGDRYNITTRLVPDITAVVDGKAVERVVENLVINALEAMPDGGTLCVMTAVENGHAVVSVADTGKGMTEEFVRDRLFHPFATTKKKGIGLGLYSCRDIVEQHGGRIDVTSQVDVGTEFRVVLPINVEEPSQAVERQAATA